MAAEGISSFVVQLSPLSYLQATGVGLLGLMTFNRLHDQTEEQVFDRAYR